MALSYTDSLGPVLDTGVGVQATVRPSTEVEVHSTNEIDSGSKNTTVQTIASHGPHRPTGHPR